MRVQDYLIILFDSPIYQVIQVKRPNCECTRHYIKIKQKLHNFIPVVEFSDTNPEERTCVA